MEVGVTVDGEDPLTGERRKAVKAYLTYVALVATAGPMRCPNCFVSPTKTSGTVKKLVTAESFAWPNGPNACRNERCLLVHLNKAFEYLYSLESVFLRNAVSWMRDMKDPTDVLLDLSQNLGQNLGPWETFGLLFVN